MVAHGEKQPEREALQRHEHNTAFTDRKESSRPCCPIHRYSKCGARIEAAEQNPEPS